jgi:hypothetical protein
MYPMLRKSNTGLNRPEATTPCPSTLVRLAWAARRSSAPADRRRRGDVGSGAPVQYPHPQAPARTFSPALGLPLFRGAGGNPRSLVLRNNVVHACAGGPPLLPPAFLLLGVLRSPLLRVGVLPIPPSAPVQPGQDPFQGPGLADYSASYHAACFRQI